MKILKQIADYQILTSVFCSDLSLFRGKMGMVLFFFLYARYSGNVRFEDFAGELLDEVCINLHTSLPITFADGLCGIGWGIEFLKKRKFIEGNTDEILVEIDRIVMERDLRRMSDHSFETGLEGIVRYVRSRLDSSSDENRSLFDPVYWDDLDGACRNADMDWRMDAYSVESSWAYVLERFFSFPVTGKESWKKGLTLIEAEDGTDKSQFVSTGI